jgi:hypothetical protein
MRELFLRAMLGGLLVAGWAASGSAAGQMHKVAKPEQVVRAVGVYEWTGDMMKPTASRLIPVTIFIEGKLEDAGVYVARPVPFALLSGNVYELQDAGVDKGMLDLVYARHLQAETATGDLAYDDGWFGYGSVKPLAAVRKTATKLKPSKTLPVLTSSTGGTTDANRPKLTNKSPGDSSGGANSAGGSDQASTKPDAGAGTTSASSDDPDRPTMKRRSSSDAGASGSTPASSGGATADTASTSGSAPADDPDRPTMKRRSSGSSADSTDSSAAGGTTAGTGSTSTASTTGTGNAQADDPDRPTMKRRTSDSTDSTTDSTASAGTGSTPANDPDRPTLKRHSAEDAKRGKNGEVSTVSEAGSLNDDPDRPNLHHGKPTHSLTEAELPKLVGLPADLHQMVAVSDAANRDPHEFTLAFDDATQRAAVLGKLQGMARAQLAAYHGAPAPSTPGAAATPAVKKMTTTAKSRRATPAAPPVALLDEELKAYTLSYGGAATYVYTAHTAGTGAALRYVTVVAQADGLGELKPAIQNVTDAAHLDRTPRMRFVDVVDVEASNRASLLFELRGQSSRQFGLYRVIAARSEQIFLTGTTQ